MASGHGSASAKNPEHQRPPGASAAQEPASSAAVGKGTGPLPQSRRSAPDQLARRHARRLALAFCLSASSYCSSRLLAQPTASRAVAADRMAERREGADEILAVQPPGINLSAPSGSAGQTALDHRARLSGTQAGTWSGTF